MAVEIRELVIRAIIVDDEDDSGQTKKEELADADRGQIVQECVEQVLKIIKRSNNR